MSDFFSTLAARVRPSAPTIEPRRPSLFETSVPDSAPLSPRVENNLEHATTPFSFSSPPGPASVEKRLFSDLPAPSASSFETPRVSPALAPTQNLFSTTVIAPAAEPSSRDDDTSTNIRTPAAGETRERPIPVGPLPPTPVVSETPRSGLLSERITTLIQAPSASTSWPSETRTAPSLPAQAPLLAPTKVRLVDAVSQLAPRSPRETPPAEAPTIHVTIGRVEVRAMVPASPQASPAPAATRKTNSVISLDDYLKQSPRAAHR